MDDILATQGVFYTYWNSIIGTIVCVIFIIVGIVLMTLKQKYTAEIRGNITSSDTNSSKYDLRYSYNGTACDIPIQSPQTTGDVIIFCDPITPCDYSLVKDPSYFVFGLLVVIVCALVISVMWWRAAFVSSNKYAAIDAGEREMLINQPYYNPYHERFHYGHAIRF